MKKLTASDAEVGDGFGISVAMGGDTAVVGAWREDVGGEDAGAAYITSTAIRNMPPEKGDAGLVGTPRASGFGLVTFGGTVEQLRDSLAIACPSGRPIFAISGGEFIGFFPTVAIAAVNMQFNARFPGGVIPTGTPLLAGNCG